MKAEAYGEEDLLTTNITRNRKSKIQKILEMYPQLLPKIWKKAVNTIGKAASFARLTLTIQNVIEFFRIFKGTQKRAKFVPFLSDEKKTKRVKWCNEI